MATLNSEIRHVYSPPTSIWGNEQRAEFVRIVGDCYGVGERNVRTWFSLNQRQTPFMRKDLPDEILLTRILLARCLVNTTYYDAYDRIERVLVKGALYNQQGFPLYPLLSQDGYNRDTFKWEYHAHEWNPNEGDSIDDICSFHLIWYYGYFSIPDWVPEHLRPEPKFETSPFGAPQP